MSHIEFEGFSSVSLRLNLVFSDKCTMQAHISVKQREDYGFQVLNKNVIKILGEKAETNEVNVT